MLHALAGYYSKTRQWLCLLLACIILVNAAGCIPDVTSDCSWFAWVSAWVDENGNGVRDASDPALESVQFHVYESSSHAEVGRKASSDYTGQAELSVGGSVCTPTHFEVSADPPTGYHLTTSRVFKVNSLGVGKDHPLQFGFSLNAGVPSPTPYQAHLKCEVYPQFTDDVSIAPDGSVWYLDYAEVARFDPAHDTWDTFPIPSQQGAFYDSLQLAADGTVWISSNVDDAAARLQSGHWDQYTGEDNFIAATDPSIGNTPDGAIWFAPHMPVDSLAAFYPASNTWRVYFGKWSNPDQPFSVRLVTDGSDWRAAFGPRSSLTPSLGADSLKWTVFDRHVFSGSETRSMPLIDAIKSARIASNGDIWIAYASGIAQFHPATDTWTLYTAETTHGALFTEANGVALAPDGSVWIAAGASHPLAFHFIPASGSNPADQWRTYDPRDGLPDFWEINSIAAGRDGSIWFGYKSGAGLSRCTPLQP